MHVVESSPYEVYQQKGIMENVPLYEMAGGTLPASEQKFIIKNVRKETLMEMDWLTLENGGEVQTTTVVEHARLSSMHRGQAYTVVRHGRAVDEFLQAIEETKPDLVVKATLGRKGLRHLLLGSVAEKVARFSPAPMLTYRVYSGTGESEPAGAIK